MFQKCIRGFLKDKAVVLVTHQLQYLKEADEIVVLKQGEVQETGTFEHLVQNGLDFSSFLVKDEEEEKDVLSETEQTEKKFCLADNMSRLTGQSGRSRTMSLVSHMSQVSLGSVDTARSRSRNS